MNRLFSRKLFGSVAAMLSIVGEVLGLAAIDPTLLTPEIVGGSVVALAALGGYQVLRQANNDDIR